MTNPSDAARERLRAQHRVRLVLSHEEGTAAGDLPPGVYGFTGSPGLAAPLFAQRRYRNFEIHHLAEGEIAIIGFVSEQAADRLAHASEPVDVTLSPDADGEATQAVAIRYSQVAHHRQYSVLNAPGMTLRVRPHVSGSGVDLRQQMADSRP